MSTRAALASGVVMMLAAGGAVGAVSPARAEPIAPPTVPSVKSWAPGGSGFTLGAHARVLYADAELGDAAVDLAAGLHTLTGRDVVAQAGSAGTPGDIVVRTGPIDAAPNTPEAYRISVGETLELSGAGPAGAFYATRSALQMLRGGAPAEPALPGGTVTDWPDYRERSLMLDVGREFMPMAMLRAQIRRMALLKLNLLHLHFSDRFGFRLASSSHPEITAEQHYSRQDLRDLIEYAARYQVEIMPEIDFPGHMDGILAAHPELKLRAADGTVSDSAIDIGNAASYALMRDILTEFLPLFPGRYWHLGADEFLLNGTRVASFDEYPQLGAYARATYGPRAQPVDAYFGLINWGANIVRAHGKRPRVWSDGLRAGEGTISPDPDIVVDYWSRAGLPQLPVPYFGNARSATDLVAGGHDVKNAAFTPAYFVTGGPAAVANVPAPVTYALWDPALFVDGTRLPAEQNSHHLGSGLYVWCDDPTVQSPEQIAASITMALRVMAQKTWGPAHAGSYAEFAARADAIAEPVA